MNNQPVGYELKAAREEKGLDILAVSQLLKIKPSKIESLEKDDYTHSALDPYHIGYINSYCKLLGLDEKIILNKLSVRGYLLHKPQQDNTQSERSLQKYYPAITITCLIMTCLWLYENSFSADTADTTESVITQPFGYNEMEN